MSRSNEAVVNAALALDEESVDYLVEMRPGEFIFFMEKAGRYNRMGDMGEMARRLVEAQPEGEDSVKFKVGNEGSRVIYLTYRRSQRSGPDVVSAWKGRCLQIAEEAGADEFEQNSGPGNKHEIRIWRD